MKTFVVRNALGNESGDKSYQATTASAAAERYASDAYFTSDGRRPDEYELLVTCSDDGKVYEVTVDIRVEFDAFVNPRTEGTEH